MTVEEFTAKPLSVQAFIAMQLAIAAMNKLDVTLLTFKIRFHNGTQEIEVTAKETPGSYSAYYCTLEAPMIASTEEWYLVALGPSHAQIRLVIALYILHILQEDKAFPWIGPLYDYYYATASYSRSLGFERTNSHPFLDYKDKE